jgi:hypothetical protein
LRNSFFFNRKKKICILFLPKKNEAKLSFFFHRKKKPLAIKLKKKKTQKKEMVKKITTKKKPLAKRKAPSSTYGNKISALELGPSAKKLVLETAKALENAGNKADKEQYQMFTRQIRKSLIPRDKLKKLRADKKVEAKKRPLSAFLAFSHDARPAIKAANPGMKITDIAKKLGSEWNKHKAAEDAVYKEYAKNMKPKTGTAKKPKQLSRAQLKLQLNMKKTPAELKAMSVQQMRKMVNAPGFVYESSPEF